MSRKSGATPPRGGGAEAAAMNSNADAMIHLFTAAQYAAIWVAMYTAMYEIRHDDPETGLHRTAS